MSRGVSNNLLEIVNSEETATAFLHLVTIFWKDGSVDRFVKNFKPIVSRGAFYQASSFSIALPEEPDDTIPTLRFQFSVSEKTILNKLRDESESPLVRLEVVLHQNTDIVEIGPFDFDVKDFQIQGASVIVEAGFEPILDLAIPQVSYTPNLFPGLFKNVSQGVFEQSFVTQIPIRKFTESSKTIPRGEQRDILKMRIVSENPSTISGLIEFDWEIPDKVTGGVGRANETVTKKSSNEEIEVFLKSNNDIKLNFSTTSESVSFPFSIDVGENTNLIVEVKPSFNIVASTSAGLRAADPVLKVKNRKLEVNDRVE